jgi:hypothetical protein
MLSRPVLSGNDSICVLFPYLFAHSEALVMVLAAYFDESAQNIPPEPISVAGFLFKPRGYRHFCRKWHRVLSAGPMPTTCFHMTELYAGRGRYEGWSAGQRAHVLSLAVDAVRKHTYGGVSVVFSQSAFETAAPPDWALKYGSMYTVACTMAMRVTQVWLDDRSNNDNVAYFFETGHRFWNEANAILNVCGRLPDAREQYRYHSHTGVGKEEAFGLQAADMLAWIMTRTSVGFPQNRTIDAFYPHLLRLMEGQASKYRTYWPQDVGLRDFFDLNAGTETLVEVPGMKHPRNRRLR